MEPPISIIGVPDYGLNIQTVREWYVNYFTSSTQSQKIFQLIWDAGLRVDGNRRYWDIPDILSIFSDRAIGGKPAHSGNVQDRSLPPTRR